MMGFWSSLMAVLAFLGTMQMASWFQASWQERYQLLDEREASALRSEEDLRIYLLNDDPMSLPPRSDHAALDDKPGRLAQAFCFFLESDPQCD